MKTLTGRLILTALCFVWALAATVPARAEQVFRALTVDATINGSCTVGNGVLHFGNLVDTTTVTTRRVGQFALDCTYGMQPITINLSNGNNPTAGLTRRQMANGVARLEYQLFSEGTYTTVWGTGMTGANGQILSVVGTGAVMQSVYGELPAQPTPATNGLYQDDVEITVMF